MSRVTDERSEDGIGCDMTVDGGEREHGRVWRVTYREAALLVTTTPVALNKNSSTASADGVVQPRNLIGGGAQKIAERGVTSDYGKTCGVHSGVKDGLVQLLQAWVAGLALQPRKVGGCVHCHVKGATSAVHNYMSHIVVNATKLKTRRRAVTFNTFDLGAPA
ncbi:hypothetical protein GOP47_0024371 [Adiantum capillus-veneris]|uniref:Uncharacterized protein n=1 Tax=Adiantum capillus-veneris TaxID=13818 RepID=A0A9D4Z4Z0_ADICA|nr:hypothetical protein GOP47_0024371 [Adiantum capillus-veneris]